MGQATGLGLGFYSSENQYLSRRYQTAQRFRDLTTDQQREYKKLGRHLDKLDGVVTGIRQSDDAGGFVLYSLTAEGAELIAQLFDL